MVLDGTFGWGELSDEPGDAGLKPYLASSIAHQHTTNSVEEAFFWLRPRGCFVKGCCERRYAGSINALDD